MSFNATAYRYISITTAEEYRTTKFVILEIIFVTGNIFSFFNVINYYNFYFKMFH